MRAVDGSRGSGPGRLGAAVVHRVEAGSRPRVARRCCRRAEPSSATPKQVDLDASPAEQLDLGEELAVALRVTHEIVEGVRDHATRAGLPVGRLLHIRTPHG
ncbi:MULTISPECIES: hypothetical protein [Sorangium]|uniref:hypothetical protein n=1 Tax=Sorangium TaxID=39643 RepID=UPI003D9C44C2